MKKTADDIIHLYVVDIKKCVADFKQRKDSTGVLVYLHNAGVKKCVDFKEMFVQSHNVGVKI